VMDPTWIILGVLLAMAVRWGQQNRGGQQGHSAEQIQAMMHSHGNAEHWHHGQERLHIHHGHPHVDFHPIPYTPPSTEEQR